MQAYTSRCAPVSGYPVAQAPRAGICKHSRIHLGGNTSHSSRTQRSSLVTTCTQKETLPKSQPISRRACGATVFTALIASRPSFAEEAFEPIMGERFAPLDITFQMPPTWKARPGQRPKSSKFLLYTDTYGPNYRYNRIWPKLKDEEGVAVDSIEVLISGLSGTERITDLGPQENVDVNRAFGIQREDLVTAEVIGAATRTDQDGQAYYEWDLETGFGDKIFVSAAASGGGLYVLCVGQTQEQFVRGGEAAKNLVQTFVVPRGSESADDISTRIYGTVKAGGFS